MKRKRIERIIKKMDGMDDLLVSDPSAIEYLTGRRIEPGERFLGLLISKQEIVTLFNNELFPPVEDEDIDTVSYADSDDLLELLGPYLSKERILGIDKCLAARFLLPIQKAGLVKDTVLGSQAVDLTRAVKDDEEIELMRKASRINDEAMALFKGLIKEGVSERQVADRMLEIYRSLGAQDYSFAPIVAFGANAADPHHMPDDTIVKEGDAVLIDVGCRYNGYCSDMTRTFFFKKGPSPSQKCIYELVRKANEEAEAMVRPGVPLCDIDKKARDIISQGGYGSYFTHRLGHFIGIDDHEYGDVSSSFKAETVPGNIFSIEPGIYDASTLGCRIEDLVLVTEYGCEVLNSYPHDIEIIE